jgi:hypothetical protein
MEPALRGIIEKVIDDELTEDVLSSNFGATVHGNKRS